VDRRKLLELAGVELINENAGNVIIPMAGDSFGGDTT
jgi:hypothetical protein